jgi:hypothetical protein
LLCGKTYKNPALAKRHVVKYHREVYDLDPSKVDENWIKVEDYTGKPSLPALPNVKSEDKS